MGEIKLVVTDLDGTFWSGREVIHPEVREAVDELDRRGVDLLIATGRRLQSVRRGMDPAGIDKPAVLMSGALGVDLATGEQWHRAGFDDDLAQTVLGAFRTNGVEPVVYLGHPELDSVARDDCATCDDHLASFGDAIVRDDPEVHLGRGVIGFGVIGADRDGIEAIGTELAELANVWVSVDDTYGGWTIMVGPREVTKLTAIAPWCAARGIGPDEVLAVGDGTNDFAMLDWAGVAVAVEDRPTADRPHDAIIPSPDRAGWTQLLDLV